jgi:hypothetical protein
MRKIWLLATLLAFGVAGAAYAATAVQNVYVVKASMKPVKSGTPTHPVPIGAHLEFTTTTIPKGQRPNLVKTIQFALQGTRAHTNEFKACSTSRLNDPTQGPATCPAGSKIGSGHFQAAIGPTGNQSQILLSCRAELVVYNGGNNTLSFYILPNAGKNGECPLATGQAFPAKVKQTKSQLTETVTVPDKVLHPAPGTDVASVDTVLDVSLKKTTVKKKTVGLFESISCPGNHQRQVSAKFTLENGKSQQATRLVPCK